MGPVRPVCKEQAAVREPAGLRRNVQLIEGEEEIDAELPERVGALGARERESLAAERRSVWVLPCDDRCQGLHACWRRQGRRKRMLVELATASGVGLAPCGCMPEARIVWRA